MSMPKVSSFKVGRSSIQMMMESFRSTQRVLQNRTSFCLGERPLSLTLVVKLRHLLFDEYR